VRLRVLFYTLFHPNVYENKYTQVAIVVIIIIIIIAVEGLEK